MRDVSHLFLKYRECCRTIWNQFLRDAAGRSVDGVLDECFEKLQLHLFISIVLWPLGLEELDLRPLLGREATGLSCFSMVPFSRCPVLMENGHAPGECVRYSEEWVAEGTRMCWLGLFDWDWRGFIDGEYFRGTVVESTENPLLKGARVLVRPHHVMVYFPCGPLKATLQPSTGT